MMLDMNYLQKPEEKQDPERKTSEESRTGAKKGGSASPRSGKSRLRRIPDKFTFPSVLHQINWITMKRQKCISWCWLVMSFVGLISHHLGTFTLWRNWPLSDCCKNYRSRAPHAWKQFRHFTVWCGQENSIVQCVIRFLTENSFGNAWLNAYR